ncbi:MAG: hypothetical protein WCA79_10700 [Anaerolineales bacterium]
MFNISDQQPMDGHRRLAMGLVNETTRRFTLSQTLAAFLILFKRDATNLFE